MNPVETNLVSALQRFEPDPNIVYFIEEVRDLAQVPRRTILIYSKYGLVSPIVDPDWGGYYFSGESIRSLRRIEYLRTTCGINLTGIKLILELMSEIEYLRKASAQNSVTTKPRRGVAPTP